MDKPVIILGAGGLGKLALEIFQSNGNLVYGFLDDDEGLIGQEIAEVPVLGKLEEQGFLKLIGNKCESFVAVDDRQLQQGLVNMLNETRKVMPVNAIHQQAYLSRSSQIGHGNLFSVGAVLNAFAHVGNHCIIGSGSLIDFEAKIGDYGQIGAGSTIGAEVEIADEVFVGSGVTLVPGIKVARNARIGAGSVVVNNVAENETVFGNPAQPVNNSSKAHGPV
ncbi:MAG: acetyltransferase [Cyclobacteriaceae bacterium]|nr:acetyltransferase [Cyclobacteriaceae bacterium]